MGKKKTLALCAAILLSFGVKANAQVKDVSFTASPVLGYTWWHNNLNMGDTPYYGVRAGIGLGPLIEFRALYERSYNLKGKLKGSSWGALQSIADKLEDAKIHIDRLGGEVKLNLWDGTALTPYLTAGGGLMNFKYDYPVAPGKYKEEQLYGSIGAGAKINLARRIALTLEGRNIFFNVDKNNHYLAAGASKNGRLHNWAAQASLDFYFGGTSEYPKDAVSRAYRDAFAGGYRGMKFSLEPGVAYINFNDKSIFRNQWFVGGSLGVDLNPLIGVRGYYYRAAQSPRTRKLKTSDHMQLFGGKFIGRLNFPQGVTPYISMGAGYMLVDKDNYVDKFGTRLGRSGLYATAGAGIDMPLHRSVAAYVAVDAMLNRQDNPNIKRILEPSQVNLSMMYQAGIRFHFGSPSPNPRDVYRNYITSARGAAREANMSEINKLRAEYESRIAKLNRELEEAARNHDAEKVSRIIEEKNALDNIKSIKSEEIIRTEYAYPKDIVLTTSQFESLVRRVVSEVKGANAQTITNANVMGSSLTDLDKILLINALSQAKYRQHLAPQQIVMPAVKKDDSKTEQLLERMEELVRRVDRLDRSNRDLRDVTLQSQVLNAPVAPIIQEVRTPSGDDVVLVTSAREPVLRFRGLTFFTGPSFGDHTTWNLGLRPIFQIGRSDFAFAPETFIGLGSNDGFGLSANVLYGFRIGKILPLKPYVGVGLGYTDINSTVRFGTNVIVGTYFTDILGGKLSVDYSIRNAFKNNQISVGYTFNF